MVQGNARSTIVLMQLGYTNCFCDNQVTLYIASNPIFMERLLSIEIDFYFIQNKTMSADVGEEGNYEKEDPVQHGD